MIFQERESEEHMNNYSNGHRSNRRTRWAKAATLALVLTLALAAVASALTAGNVDGVWGSPTPSNTSNFDYCRGSDNLTGPAGNPLACGTYQPSFLDD